MAHFTKHTVTLQPQAQYCMEKEHISVEEILETLNEWESGNVQCTNIKDLMLITEHPETEDEEQIPTFCEMEKDIADRRMNVTYSTYFHEQAGKKIKYATVHWVSVSPLLTDMFSNDHPQASYDWLEPRTRKHSRKIP
jgi:hypothetical protein